MTSERPALVETPLYLPVGNDHVFAVGTQPVGEPNGVGVVLAMGGIYKFSIQRNRFQVRLARRLAERGYHVVRYDVHGTGESSGVVERHEWDAPFSEETEAAAAWLEGQGIEHLVLGGSCAGGRACMKAATNLERVRALALLSVPVVDYDWTMRVIKQAERLPTGKLVKAAASKEVLSGFLNKERRSRYVKAVSNRIRGVFRRRNKDWGVSSNFARPLETLFERKVPVLIAYGKEPMFGDFQTAKTGYLGKLLQQAGGLVQFRVYKEHLHGFNTLHIQDEATELVESWIVRVAPGTRRGTSATVPDGDAGTPKGTRGARKPARAR